MEEFIQIRSPLSLVSFIILISCGSEGIQRNNLLVSDSQEAEVSESNADSSSDSSANSVEREIKSLQNQYLNLTGTSNLIAGLLSSDFASCPASGNTADALIRKICQISQAANAEQMITIKEQLALVNKALQEKLNSINDDISRINATDATIQTTITSIQDNITTIQGNLTTLQGQMTSAQAAVVALQSSFNSLSTTVNNTLLTIKVGEENPFAGPAYQPLYRQIDKTKINAYIEVNSSNITLSSATPLKPANNKNTIIVTRNTSTVTGSGNPTTFTWNSHHFSNNDPVLFTTTGTLPSGISANTIYYVISATTNTFRVSASQGGTAIGIGSGSGTHTGTFGLEIDDIIHMENFASGSGMTSDDLTGDFMVVDVNNPTTFTINTRKDASANTAFGGSAGRIRKFFSRNIGPIWQSTDGADSSVRTTTFTSTSHHIPYNYVIKANGDICYDTALASQTFTNIITSPVSTVVCK